MTNMAEKKEKGKPPVLSKVPYSLAAVFLVLAIVAAGAWTLSGAAPAQATPASVPP